MNKEQLSVEEFHKAFNIFIAPAPGLPSVETRDLRIDLITEELNELEDAFKANDLVETADAIADLLYVVYGTAVSCGIDIRPVFEEVHRSNMTKVGGHKADNGKWIKPDTYSPADIKSVLTEQGAELVL